MINLNERSAIENYLLLEKLPAYTHIRDYGKNILKDSKYYNATQFDN